ncbi:MAG: ABC transporter ATP-binding protein [Bacteroidales bacterium]
MSIDRVVIRLENVSVRYRTPAERYNTFKEFAIRWLQGKVRNNSFWALRNVSFEINKGEVFGIIGQNGAGKSTLLKLVSRVMRPTEGRVEVIGRVVPLLELGAGFHPELTGRENIYLNGSIFGFNRKEMEAKFHRIVEFSELHDFIEAPLRTYSSGMWARLGFAVAIDAEPDILILDEILSVGDEAFQRKCLARFDEFLQKGTTIVLVSHNTQLIEQMCQRAAWLAHGQLQSVGPASEVVRAYRENQNIN